MNEPKVGRKLPSRLLPPVPKGKSLVLYFYPKDMTSGCTREGIDFTAQHSAFKKAKVTVAGVSADSTASHEKFKAKHKFPFELLSDADKALCQLFDVIREKSLYGRRYLGIERSTFLIDAKGVLRQEWRKVKVDGHVAAVLAAAKAL